MPEALFYKNGLNNQRENKSYKGCFRLRKKHRFSRCADCFDIKTDRQAGFAFEEPSSRRALKKGLDYNGHQKEEIAGLLEKNIREKIFGSHQKNRTQKINAAAKAKRTACGSAY